MGRKAWQKGGHRKAQRRTPASLSHHSHPFLVSPPLQARKPHMVTASLANAAAGGGGDDGAPTAAPVLFNCFAEAEADAFVAAMKGGAAAC